MKRAAWVVIVLVLAVCGTASAAQPALSCLGCSNADMRRLALVNGAGYHYVYDLRSQRLTYWHVLGGTSPTRRVAETTGGGRLNPDAGGNAVEQLPVPSDVAAWWSRLMRLATDNHGMVVSMTLSYKDLMGREPAVGGVRDVSAGPTYHLDRFSAWDVVDPGGQRRHFLALAEQRIDTRGLPVHVPDAKHEFVNQLSRDGVLKVERAGVLVTIVMKDQSRISVTWDAPKRAFKIVPGTAYDRFGNSIPDTWQDVTNGKYGQARYTFPDNVAGKASYQEFARRLGYWGIRVGDGDKMFHGVAMVCAGVGDAKVCTVTKYRQ